MPQATAEGTTCSFLMITVRQKAGRHAVMRYSAYRHLSLTVSKVILFNTGIFALEKKVRFIFVVPSYFHEIQVLTTRSGWTS
jgi:hypothetical protein